MSRKLTSQFLYFGFQQKINGFQKSHNFIVRLKVCTKNICPEKFQIYKTFHSYFDRATTKVLVEAQFSVFEVTFFIWHQYNKIKSYQTCTSSFSWASSSMYTCIEVASFELFLRYIRIENDVSACCVNSSDLQLHLKTVTVR